MEVVMDKEEARALLAEQLGRYRAKTYAELKGLIDEIDAFEITGKDGVSYQVEIHLYWDVKPEGNICVGGSIDDGTWRGAFSPVTLDFIMAPDGTFVGESTPP
jgi:hypothetical protein